MKRVLLLCVFALSAFLVFAAGGSEDQESSVDTSRGVAKYSGEIVVSIAAGENSIAAAESLIEAYIEYQPDVKVYWEPISARTFKSVTTV